MERVYFTRVQKPGNAHVLYLPKPILNGTGIQRGDTVVFCQFGVGQFSVRKLSDEEIRALSMPIIKI